MKSFSLLLRVTTPLQLFILVNARPKIRDDSSTAVDMQDGERGVLMILPPRQTDTGHQACTRYVYESIASLSYPLTTCTIDADHPFIAPGPNDMRGREVLLRENFDFSFTQ